MKTIAKLFGLGIVAAIMAGASIQTKTSPVTGEAMMSVEVVQEAEAAGGCGTRGMACTSTAQCICSVCYIGHCR